MILSREFTVVPLETSTNRSIKGNGSRPHLMQHEEQDLEESGAEECGAWNSEDPGVNDTARDAP